MNGTWGTSYVTYFHIEQNNKSGRPKLDHYVCKQQTACRINIRLGINNCLHIHINNFKKIKKKYMYKAGVWQSITELNKLSLFSLHDYFWSISWRFVLADKAKRFVAMTPEEKKESTCRLYAKVFQSDEALHVGILQKTKKWYQFEFFISNDYF